MRTYDITALFSEGLPEYGGGGSLQIAKKSEIARGAVCNELTLRFDNHTGTHADMPKHFIDKGLSCDNIPLDRFLGTAKLFDLRRILGGRKSVELSDIGCLDINEDDIVLFNTGNSPLMREKVFTPDYVSLSPGAARYLAEKKVKTVGIDYLSVEKFGDPDFPVHKTLLGSGITVLEGLAFDQTPLGFVPQGTYFLSALPLKIQDGDGSPVRAVLTDGFEPRLVIFDMDGLILDTESVSVDGWAEAGKRLGFTIPDELFDELFGCGKAMCKQRMVEYFKGIGFDFEEAFAIRR
jgi:arylformamidase